MLKLEPCLQPHDVYLLTKFICTEPYKGHASYRLVKMSKCPNVELLYGDVEMSRCRDVKMSKCPNVELLYGDVEMSKCPNVELLYRDVEFWMSKCRNVEMSRC